MFNWLFKKKEKESEKSSSEFIKNGQRFLKIPDTSCAIVIHETNEVEVIFTRADSFHPDEQPITDNEEQLMALAIFMKRPGFMEMLVNEFRRLANEGIMKPDEIEEKKK